MKKSLLLLLFVFVIPYSSLLKAQEWFPVGAKWTYRYFQSLGPNYREYPKYYQVLKDTVILGKACKKINRSAYSSSPSYRYQENRRVYYYEPHADSTWNLLYDFNVSIGDTIKYPQFTFIDFLSNDTLMYTLRVATTYNVKWGNQILKVYWAFPIEIYCIGCGNFATYAVEKISGGEVQWYGGDFFGGGPLGLRCYEDTISGLYKSPWFNLDCDTTLRNVGLENKLDPNLISIYPNPAKNSLNIQSEIENSNETTFRMFDLNGAILKEVLIDSPNSSIDISNLKSGMYIYEIESDGRFHRDKLIIE